MRSCVAAHRATWRSPRSSSGVLGGTRRPVAFITSSTFLSDSGTASYYTKMQLASMLLPLHTETAALRH